MCGVLAAAIRVVQEAGCGCPLHQRHVEGMLARCTVGQWPIAQPITMREYRSSTTARYSQPSIVHTYVSSPAHTRLGGATWNWRLRAWVA